ncbi:related to aspartate--tRNA ligase, mitochondrial [Ustilago sp. UG-2017a]|nr:related to aspartate--tRNA ligase, mitochondrial [Ustilago sp. UG-2017a]
MIAPATKAAACRALRSASLSSRCCCHSPHAGPSQLRAFATTLAVRHPDSSSQASSSQAFSSQARVDTVSSSSSHDAFYGAFPARTHTCRELRPSHAERDVILTGWLQSSRQVSKQLGFLTIFDHTGSVQLKVQPTPDSPSLLETFATIPLQSAVLVRGKVALRPTQDSNATQSTGAVEVLPESFTLLNPATRDLPFQPSDSVHADGVSTELRAHYRYLDLRRPSLAQNIRLRSHITHAIRSHLYDQDFLEIETPLLLRSTPEGAREFLVPTRTSCGSNSLQDPTFYALPQSPQQPKQLLIASGVTDKYFQIAKCFRDEDGRKDRQPEFTQIDLEMGFVSGGPSSAEATQHSPVPSDSNQSVDARDAQGQWRIGGHQVRDVIEGLVSRIWQVAGRGELPARFPVMSYWTAMTRYGSDKPDLRYNLALHDISSAFVSSSDPDPKPELCGQSLEILPYQHHFTGSLSKKELDNLLSPFKGKVERFRIASIDNIHELAALLLKKSALTRTFLSRLEHLPASEVKVEHLASTLSSAINAESRETDAQQPIDILLSLRKDPPEGGSTTLGHVRKLLASSLISKNLLELKGDVFTWITEFPLFTLADDDKNQLSTLSSGSSTTRWQSSHHPFTAPVAQDIPLLEPPSPNSTQVDPAAIAQVRGQHYDLVLNGQEIGGGSVRIHSRKLQETVFRDVLKLDDAERARFAHLIHALDCGAPPHGGIALGFDRLTAILCNTESIRDVIAFPKQGSGVDPLFGSPAPLRDQTESRTATDTTDTLLRMYGLAKAPTGENKSRNSFSEC